MTLMLGFHATYAGGEAGLGVDRELEDVRWYSRDEVASAISGDASWIDGPASDRLMVPPPTAIARLLLDRWVEET
jgi:NAD+ diphosphatase